MQRMRNYILARKKRFIALMLVGLFMATTAESCDDTGASGQEKENKSRQSNYEKLTDSQPAHSMSFSPTRATKNFWIDTWNQKGKLAYVYLLNNAGAAFGYFITEGLPVSYCTSLVVPYQFKQGDQGDYNGDFVVPGPSIDGTFSSASNCSEYYGKDAVSGAYVEYSVGQGINALIFDQAMPQYGDAKPLGDASLQDAQQEGLPGADGQTKAAPPADSDEAPATAQ